MCARIAGQARLSFTPVDQEPLLNSQTGIAINFFSMRPKCGENLKGAVGRLAVSSLASLRLWNGERSHKYVLTQTRDYAVVCLWAQSHSRGVQQDIQIGLSDMRRSRVFSGNFDFNSCVFANTHATLHYSARASATASSNYNPACEKPSTTHDRWESLSCLSGNRLNCEVGRRAAAYPSPVKHGRRRWAGIIQSPCLGSPLLKTFARALLVPPCAYHAPCMHSGDVPSLQTKVKPVFQTSLKHKHDTFKITTLCIAVHQCCDVNDKNAYEYILKATPLHPWT